ncbi:hypothetical protein HERIO_1861 [Hepatospora eriocheir]|uniref:Uncharacterized protein n=1 Tax=Hepatospora eriocheir TaxID=1081669 RepID=A0A1X0Q8U1_9MICR|nr:hypothetical protein HERIO_1861 [Hepatospora eriocheir]
MIFKVSFEIPKNFFNKSNLLTMFCGLNSSFLASFLVIKPKSFRILVTVNLEISILKLLQKIFVISIKLN